MSPFISKGTLEAIEIQCKMREGLHSTENCRNNTREATTKGQKTDAITINLARLPRLAIRKIQAN